MNPVDLICTSIKCLVCDSNFSPEDIVAKLTVIYRLNLDYNLDLVFLQISNINFPYSLMDCLPYATAPECVTT